MTAPHVERLLDLGSLPFHVGVADSASNDGSPDVLPFVVGLRRDVGLLVQAPDSHVEAQLDEAYRRGFLLGSPMAEDGFGRRYAEDFLGFICRSMGPRTLEARRVLEIGCGSGYLLHLLRQRGARVLGIEPGEHGQEGARRYGVPIIRGMFPSEDAAAQGAFDVVLHYGVLEHVPDPAQFLGAQVERLSPSGMIVFAVPDCAEHLAKGDVAMLAHVHWSYFSPASLRAVIERAGLLFVHLEKSGYGGALYAVAQRGEHPEPGLARAGQAEHFAARAVRGIDGARAFFADAARSGRSVGVLAAARFINLLHLAQPARPPRFFDDDPRLHGKYYPPFDVAVESRAALLANPVDDLIIASRSFGEMLRDELQREEALQATRIWLPDDVLAYAGSDAPP